MKWVELMRIRSGSDLSEALGDISREVRDLADASQAYDAMVLQHALFDGDLAVVLTWDNDRKPQPTREGILLAKSLQRYGMVDHSAWVAAPGFERNMTCHADGAESVEAGQ